MQRKEAIISSFFLLFLLIPFSFCQFSVAEINCYLSSDIGGTVIISSIELNNGSTGSSNFNANRTSANITINYVNGTHDHVLNISDTSSSDFLMKLRIENVVNLSNLNRTIIYFKNTTGGLIEQVRIEEGGIVTDTGSYERINQTQNISLVVDEQGLNYTITSQIQLKLVVKEIGYTLYYNYEIILELD